MRVVQFVAITLAVIAGSSAWTQDKNGNWVANNNYIYTGMRDDAGVYCKSVLLELLTLKSNL
jgi:hypothetical protein